MIGKTLGPYNVVAKLGEGGMGEVYRARDTRLNRDVALKLLPAAVANDPDRLARFRREAQVLATLNHPNVAQIYGLEDAGPAAALVMELVPGRTLAEMLQSQGRIRPIADVARIARQIAEGLEAAHERAVIHRDLKPANIKVRDDGVVKILDFGLAKEQADATLAAADDQATVTSPALSEIGVILGTAAYMAPEQALGKPVDKRADVWAFGVVLYEMLTGERPFAGQSVTETIAAVIKDDPRIDRLPADTPPVLRTLVTRCLERDPQRRLRDIGEARIALAGPLDAPETARIDAGATRRFRAVSWTFFAAASLVLAGLAAFAAWSMKPAPRQPLRTLDLAMPAALDDFAISNDGSRIAYLSDNHLYVRRFDELAARDLGVQHVTARQLTWAPDDRAIAFTAQSRIHTIPADGGPVFVVTDIPASGRAMDVGWMDNGTIVFSVWRDSLYNVPAAGGKATVLLAVAPDREIDFHQLTRLPGNRLVVATHRRQEDADIIELVHLDESARRVTLTTDPDVRNFRYVPVQGGRLFFGRVATNPGVWSLPFDDDGVNLEDATLLLAGASDFRVAGDGTLLGILPAPLLRSLVWIDETGKETPVPGDPLDTPDLELELSPDGRRAAFVHGRWREAGSATGSLTEAIVIVRDLETGSDTRLAVGARSSTMWGSIGLPAWFPDGQRILHRTGRVENSMLVERRADMAGTARELTPGFQGRLLPDGRTLIYTRDDRGAGRLARLTIDAAGNVSSPEPLFPGTQPDVGDFDISANGRLIAFVARQPNQRGDVFIAEFDRPAEQWLVQEGANRPRFPRDGQWLYVARGVVGAGKQPEGQLVRFPIRPTPRLSIGPPVVVFRDSPDGPRLSGFDVAPEGRRFLMPKRVPPRPGEGQRLILVQNALAR